ncbi:MAG TPA: hypothetical protein VHH88_13020, partial [Verrucomicrobiae bacterium]|nr:hypothetical protein [Verrucomicrobiae bacterium]
QKLPDDQIIHDLYLDALSREPTPGERTKMLAAITQAEPGGRRQALEDVYWAVLSSKEFLFNH